MKLLHDYLYRFALRVIISTALLICLYNHKQNVAYVYSFFMKKLLLVDFNIPTYLDVLLKIKSEILFNLKISMGLSWHVYIQIC